MSNKKKGHLVDVKCSKCDKTIKVDLGKPLETISRKLESANWFYDGNQAMCFNCAHRITA